MAEQTSGTNEQMEDQEKNQESTPEINSWAAAFEALERAGKGDSENPADAGAGNDMAGGAVAGTTGDDKNEEVSTAIETNDGVGNETNIGGLDNPVGDDDSQNGTAFTDMLGVTEDSIKEYEDKLDKEINDRAINDIAQEFIKRGVRHRNGVLGATLDDPDICKREEDGVPVFYNPETGREFTGDNPRRQAQEWCDDYNKELARVFNNACDQYARKLKEDSAPRLAVMKFAPKYEKLDPIRKGLFENAIQDYEIQEDGKVVGYSCDLDRALAMVERQIGMIQNYAKQHASEQKPAASGPALDMKTSSGAVQTPDAPPSSLEEAMLRIQNQKLESLKH